MFNFLKYEKKEIKICKDCKWMIKAKYDYLEEYSRCRNAKVSEFSKVTGKIDPYFCSVGRQYKCGKEAKYFEAKDE